MGQVLHRECRGPGRPPRAAGPSSPLLLSLPSPLLPYLSSLLPLLLSDPFPPSCSFLWKVSFPHIPKTCFQPLCPQESGPGLGTQRWPRGLWVCGVWARALGSVVSGSL